MEANSAATCLRNLGHRRCLYPGRTYSRLLSVREADARADYEEEAIRGGWSVRQLDRLIATLAFQRTQSKAGRLHRGALEADEPIRDPFEFLPLKDEYSETELEQQELIR